MDAQLEVAVQAQLEVIQSGLSAINHGQTEMTGVQQEMNRIDKICQSSQALVKNFEVINAISKCHINFVQTLEMVDKLENLGKTLDELRQQLDEDRQDASSSNLLSMHFHLSKLLDFRDVAVRQSASARKDVQDTLKRYFIPLEDFSRQFEEHLFTLSAILLDTLRQGDPSLVVRIAKIVYVEDVSDVRSKTLQDAQSSRKQGSTKSRVIAGDARNPRNYKQKFLDSIQNAIKLDFEGCLSTFPEPADLLENLEWIFQDLALVQQEVTIRTPKDWDMFTVFLKFYHQETYTVLNKVLALEPDGSTLLKLLEWVKLYGATMKSEFHVNAATLEPRLLDGKENDLIEDYLKIIVKKMEEWMQSLKKSEVKSFTERTEQPEMSPEGIYGMQGAVIMFQMVSQQIDVAADSGQGRVLASVVSECVRIMKDTQLNWVSVLQQETKLAQDAAAKAAAGKEADDVPPGLPDYIIALANDQIRSADYCEAISARVAPLVSAKYAANISEGLSAATDGFLDVAKSCLQALNRVIAQDVQSTFAKFFTKEWYGGSQMSLIVSTYREYIADCKDHLNEHLMELFLDELLDAFLVSYMEALALNNKATLKIPKVLEQMTAEIGLAFNLFVEHIDLQNLQVHFDVLEMVIAFVQTDAETVQEDYSILKSRCWDVPGWLIEGILERRDDINKKQVRNLLDMISKMDAQDPRPEDPVPTIMSRLRLRK
jgi:hypothetical protein